MANNITNIVTINADENLVREILTEIKDDEFGMGSIDFNKVIPLSERMNISNTPDAQKALAFYRGCMHECMELLMSGKDPELIAERQRYYRFNLPEMWKLGKEYYNDIQKYGTGSEVDIKRKFWGSKWNSYGYKDLPKYEDGSNTIRFHSANASVPKVMEELSAMFPTAEFAYRWADENTGYNVGEAKYKNGICREKHIPVNDSLEAYELAIDIRNIVTDGADAEWMLSADASTYVQMGDDDFSLAYVKEQPLMFTERALTTADIPQGMHLYTLDMMDGSIVSKEPLEADENNCLILDEPDEDLNFTDDYVSLRDYRNGDFGAEQGIEMNM